MHVVSRRISQTRGTFISARFENPPSPIPHCLLCPATILHCTAPRRFVVHVNFRRDKRELLYYISSNRPEEYSPYIQLSARQNINFCTVCVMYTKGDKCCGPSHERPYPRVALVTSAGESRKVRRRDDTFRTFIRIICSTAAGDLHVSMLSFDHYFFSHGLGLPISVHITLRTALPAWRDVKHGTTRSHQKYHRTVQYVRNKFLQYLLRYGTYIRSSGAFPEGSEWICHCPVRSSSYSVLE